MTSPWELALSVGCRSGEARSTHPNTHSPCLHQSTSPFPAVVVCIPLSALHSFYILPSTSSLYLLFLPFLLSVFTSRASLSHLSPSIAFMPFSFSSLPFLSVSCLFLSPLPFPCLHLFLPQSPPLSFLPACLPCLPPPVRPFLPTFRVCVYMSAWLAPSSCLPPITFPSSSHPASPSHALQLHTIISYLGFFPNTPFFASHLCQYSCLPFFLFFFFSLISSFPWFCCYIYW